MADPTLPPARYEASDVTFRLLLYGACLVLGVVLLCTFGVMWLYPNVVQDHRLAGVLADYPTPRLQADPVTDLKDFKQQQLSRLSRYGWVEKDRGIVHIPIDEAMRRIAAQGIPDWPSPQGSHR